MIEKVVDSRRPDVELLKELKETEERLRGMCFDDPGFDRLSERVNVLRWVLRIEV